jgi:hypothetical protein
MRAGQDRQTDQVDVLVRGHLRDLRGREADTRIDGLHPEVARADGQLLCGVAVAVQAGFADEHADASDAELLRDLGHALACVRDACDVQTG